MLRAVVRTTALALVLCGAAFAADSAGAWLDVPFVRQSKEGCGAASIAMVMQYWQRQLGQPASSSADAERILRALYSSAAHGIYNTDMVRYFQQHGYRTFAFPGQWADLEQHLARGRPLIVGLRPYADNALHYVVVTGIDPRQQLVLLNDPAQRKLLKEDRATFEQEWKVTGYWTLLAVPQPSTPH